MATASPGRPSGILLRDLLLAAALGVGLYALFGIFNGRLLHGLTAPEVVLLEGGAVVLVAFLVARAVTNATNAFLSRHGLVPRGHAVRLFLNLLIAIGTVLALFRLGGVSAESVLLGAGFTGIVLGLASQTVLSNVFAGVLLVFADPFRPGDRVGFLTWQFGLLGPSYPHEAILPTYTGTVEDVGLTYTIVSLDSGGLAKIPNGIVIQALVVLPQGAVVHRVRMTFPRSVPPSQVEAALPALTEAFPKPYTGAPAPRLDVADLAPSTWDGVIVLWSAVRDADEVRDRVIRTVLPRVAPPAAP
jgi:small conductance mechanosensitive channel